MTYTTGKQSRTSVKLVVSVSLLILSSALVYAQEHAYVVQGVPTAGAHMSAITGLNDSGDVIGTTVLDAEGRSYGFLFMSRSAQLTKLPSLCSDPTLCDGNSPMLPNFINNAGVVVGRGVTLDGTYHAFLYDPTVKVSTDLGTLGGPNSSALAINDSGVVVGWSETASGQTRGFRYDVSSKSVMALPTLGGDDSMAVAIDNDGHIVGLADTSFGTFSAALWSCSDVCSVHPLDALGGNAAAYGIGSGGMVTGEAETTAGSHAFLTTLGGHGASDLGTLGGLSSIANGVAASGEVIGSTDIATSLTSHAFIVRNGTMSDLNELAPVPAGWVLYDALGINRRGQIAVNAIGGDGIQGFILTPLVVDTTPPALTLSADIVAEALGATGTPVMYDASATDASDGEVLVLCNPATGTIFPLGTTAVNCTATDAHGNTANGYFAITVRDTVPPTIDHVPDMVVEASGPQGSVMSFTSPTSNDAVDGAGLATCVPSSGSTFALGATRVVCSAIDAAGNLSNNSFGVVVRDTVRPALTLPAPVTVDATTPGGTSVSYAVTVADTVDLRPSVACVPSSGSNFPMGLSTVTCTAIDASGNSSSGTFTVYVRGAAEQLARLLESLRSAPIPEPARTKLIGFLNDALANSRFVARVCRVSAELIAWLETQRGAQFPPNIRSHLLLDVVRIRGVIGC